MKNKLTLSCMDGLCGGVTKACECSSNFFCFDGIVCDIFSLLCSGESTKRYKRTLLQDCRNHKKFIIRIKNKEKYSFGTICKLTFMNQYLLMCKDQGLMNKQTIYLNFLIFRLACSSVLDLHTLFDIYELEQFYFTNFILSLLNHFAQF